MSQWRSGTMNDCTERIVVVSIEPDRRPTDRRPRAVARSPPPSPPRHHVVDVHSKATSAVAAVMLGSRATNVKTNNSAEFSDEDVSNDGDEDTMMCLGCASLTAVSMTSPSPSDTSSMRRTNNGDHHQSRGRGGNGRRRLYGWCVLPTVETPTTDSDGDESSRLHPVTCDLVSNSVDAVPVNGSDYVDLAEVNNEADNDTKNACVSSADNDEKDNGRQWRTTGKDQSTGKDGPGGCGGESEMTVVPPPEYLPGAVVDRSEIRQPQQYNGKPAWLRTPTSPCSADSVWTLPPPPPSLTPSPLPPNRTLPTPADDRHQPCRLPPTMRSRAVSFDPTAIDDRSPSVASPRTQPGSASPFNAHADFFFFADDVQSPLSGTSCPSSAAGDIGGGLGGLSGVGGFGLGLVPFDQLARLHGRIAGYETTTAVGHASGTSCIGAAIAAADNNNTTLTLIAPPTTESETERRGCIVRLPEDDLFSSLCVTEDEAQEALLASISTRWCYGKAAAKEMDVYRVSTSYALHYTLETFTEKRSTCWDQEPYAGQRVDGPDNGPAPLPWDIHCNPTQMFHNEIRFIEVPHTATISCCYACGALGWTRCNGCLGRGFKRCVSCCGSGRTWRTDSHGRRHIESCWHCHGTGRKRCSGCSGDGRTVCKSCQGHRNLKCFIKLRVEYANNFSEYVIERTELPKHLIKSAGGEYLLDETQPKIFPIVDYPDDDLCSVSHDYLRQHLNAARNSRILMQRQKLRVVSVSECAYTWADFEGHFWVYGKELAVYAPDYPQKYCWGCTIM